MIETESRIKKFSGLVKLPEEGERLNGLEKLVLLFDFGLDGSGEVWPSFVAAADAICPRLEGFRERQSEKEKSANGLFGGCNSDDSLGLFAVSAAFDVPVKLRPGEMML